jgi:ubiquinone/menaquinone biosynthesis C-methylase UbiE
MTTIGMPIRNIFLPPRKMLSEVEIKPGYHVLDYGCGPGTFSRLISKKIGDNGTVYALDVHPLAIQSVEKKIKKEKLSNIKTIHSECSTSLPDNILDLVIFYDVFHVLHNQKEVLMELHRVLKPRGIMSFSDHHMKESESMQKITEGNLFEFEKKGKFTYTFVKRL